MYFVHLTVLANSRSIRLDLKQADAVIASARAAKAEEIFPALDEILKRSKLEPTNVEDISVTCESGASFLSCQMAEATRDAFVFSRSVGVKN